mmetsp:Transcript_7504/g.12606  ORF Transcript_7504/g.12606 Transcript_7504/m.12606 type:complete len:149 (+) Transcript_7504:105-551(+)|eukprot:CAMPEP_0114432884 /NCGR_PEP_ID=MMETSP0103-20121206/11395_1 /TAXON_ID=37642 ORGANISM="Paraphysomonas imperforata, Strain PA2" /NCGR_SAMPLE_ID=MMETSP0103 /ASSEMBLY_ACC=CAM_ASM_000201 /LENGTH=148 /DNA_ID=CAMNT_0001602593 /DNA_START=85 /DNA_END=531 /DNA_ORIENTATION=+
MAISLFFSAVSFWALLLGLLSLSAASLSSSFQPLSRAEVNRLSLESKLWLLEERGLSCEDCSEQDVNEEVFSWQQLPVLKRKQSTSSAQKGVHDEANVQEVLEQMRNSGFGRPSSFTPQGMGGSGAQPQQQPQFPRKQQGSKKKSRRQ